MKKLDLKKKIISSLSDAEMTKVYGGKIGDEGFIQRTSNCPTNLSCGICGPSYDTNCPSAGPTCLSAGPKCLGN